MQTQRFEVPIMYGDHHVTEVRRILLELPGVKDVYASSSFHVIEVIFDPQKTSADEIGSRLEAEGYLGELPTISEPGVAVYNNGVIDHTFFRHTESYETTKDVISFAQRVNVQSRPLWPCPGLGVLNVVDE